MHAVGWHPWNSFEEHGKRNSAFFVPTLQCVLIAGLYPFILETYQCLPRVQEGRPHPGRELYKSISLLCNVSIVLERCVFSHCCPRLSSSSIHCDGHIFISFIFFCYHLKQSFLKGKSTVTQLLEVYQDILETA